MRIDELETGMILHFTTPDGEVDIECAVTDTETEVSDWNGVEDEAVRACFLDDTIGYRRGEVCCISLDSFREFVKEG